MSFNAEIVGKSADFYRAYASDKMLRRPSNEDHIKRAAAKAAPLTKGAKIRYDVEQVVMEGKVTGDALTLSTKEGVTITKVVFYKNETNEEAPVNEHHTFEDAQVVGSCDVNATGTIVINIVEPVGDKLQIVDENDIAGTVH